MSVRKINIKNPEDAEIWFKCVWCHIATTHKILTSVRDKTSESIVNDDEVYEDALWWINLHQIVQCQKCQRLSYRKESTDSESQGDEELGIPDQYDVITYPGDLAERIFEDYKAQVDLLLLKQCHSVIQKIPVIYKRLSEGGNEAISQALTSCRRIIASFAQTIYPPPEKEQDVNVAGKLLKLSSQNYINLIEAYVREHTTSVSRRDRIRKILEGINNRVCAGVHNDVTPEEARALFMQTYLILGEILNIEEPITEMDFEVEN